MSAVTLAVERPATRSVLMSRIRQIAAERGGNIAISGPHTRLGYRDLIERADAWAELLRGYAPPPGAVVALRVMDPTFLAPAFLAVRDAGLVPTLIDSQAPASRRAAVLDAARPALLMDVRDMPEIAEVSSEPRLLPAGAGYLGFTSGTQGPPKGIVAQERGVLRFIDWEISTLSVGPTDRVAMISPPTFEVVFREMFVGLGSGAQLVTADVTTRADPRAVLPWLAERDITVVHAVPGLAARWMAAAPGVHMDRLRWTLFAGEPLHACHVDAWRDVARHTEVGNLYGPSETTLAKFWYHVPRDRRPGLQPVGRPLPGARLRPLEAADGVFRVGIDTPDGSFGYLEGTASPADHAALTRTAGTTVFRSQDLGMLDADGDLIIKGRLDARVKRRGVFVDLGAIEEAANRLPGVASAACVHTTPATGGSIVLCVEVDVRLSVPDLRRALLRVLGPESPDRVVAVPRLPLSPNGKIDRRALLAALEAESAPLPERASA
ncbi:AMP-binding protein (plasmid) [Streptomyces sp. NBC_01216]|uniref:AMP-binding protein n=1 Tax=Streptomyces sp. NBC_01216 TaxID=2903778 RepID=UPI002E124828|nr:AMP-binding protein [Streptomyces sp. NBC_01216]